MMGEEDPRTRVRGERYIASARVALGSWREVRIAWLESLRTSSTPLPWEEANCPRATRAM